MPEASGAGNSAQSSNRGPKGKNNAKDRENREDSVGESKDGFSGNASGVGVGNASEGKGGSGINRVNRACNHCRRMKMRCVGAEDPPCKRCRATGQDCVMEKPTKGTSSLADVGDDRIKHLETQVTSIQNTLADLVSSIKAGGVLASAGAHSSASPATRPGMHDEQSPINAANPYPSPASSGAYYATHGYSNPLPPPPPGTIPGYSTGRVPSTSLPAGQAYSAAEHALVTAQHPASGGPNHGSLQPRSSRAPPATMDPSMRANSFSSTSSGHALSQGLGNQAFNTSHTRGSTHGGAHAPLHFQPPANLYPAYPPQVDYQGNRMPGLSMLIDPDLKDSFAWSLNNVNNPSSVPGAFIRTKENFGTNPSPDALPPPAPATPGGHRTKPNSGVNTANRSGGGTTPLGSDIEDDADPLAPSSIMDPLGSMSSMAGLAEAAVERARAEKMLVMQHIRPDGEKPRPDAENVGNSRVRDSREDEVKPIDFASRPFDGGDDDQPRKKRRTDSSSAPADRKSFAIPIDPALMQPPTPALLSAYGNNQYSLNPGQGSQPRGVIESRRYGKGKQKVRSHVHAFPDIVDLGLVSETEAKELFDLFFSGSSNFLPVYDPTYDTWDDLRMRSPFSISAIVSVGARVRDGGGPMSNTQKVALEHSRKIALGTLFTPVTRIEAVQSMIVLAAFSDQGWLPTGHAVRMALDMELNHCFTKLLRDNMGQGKSPDELEADRDLVHGARVWFCLYMIEHQMSYGTGRPAILREDEAIVQCRRFLEHPLSIISDIRLISTVECIALRAPLHVVLTSSPEEPVDQMTVARLQQANYDLDRWQNYWDRVLAERFNKDEGDFFRESLAAQREYSSLFINSQLLRGIKEAADVRRMPQDKRDLAIRAMRNAQTCLDIAIRGKNYRNGLRFAVHYTHVCAAFAASFLIRIARLFPRELDLKKTAKDVEELASVLEKVPAGRYARSLRLILRRARRQKHIPPPSVPGSPNKGHMPIGSSGLRPLTAMPHTVNLNASTMAQSSLMPNSGLLPTNQSSPGNSLQGALSGGKNESPSSNPESYDYDWNFAQELLHRAGMPMEENSQLPLFLNGESLGNGTEGNANIAMGLETFFLPPDIDSRINTLGNGVNYNDPNFLQGLPVDQTYELPPDMWW